MCQYVVFGVLIYMRTVNLDDNNHLQYRYDIAQIICCELMMVFDWQYLDL